MAFDISNLPMPVKGEAAPEEMMSEEMPEGEEEVEEEEMNPLASFSDEELLAEVESRGLKM